MGTTTKISWTDHTFNPWWGCERVSPACRFCYAEAFAKRTGHPVWGADAPRRFFGEKHWAEPLKWNRAAEAEGRPHRVFCASMADVFEDRRDLDESRARLFELIEATPWLRWQLLTKRPERVTSLVPAHWITGNWPGNAWIGTTVEDQERADERLPHLVAIPAPVRFLSCEPQLGRITLHRWLRSGDVHWVIVGGESGPRHRPLDIDDARALCWQVLYHEVPLWFKQIGGLHPTSGGDVIDVHDNGDARQYHQLPAEARS